MTDFPRRRHLSPPPRALTSACQEDSRLKRVLLLARATLKRSHFLWNQTKALNTSNCETETNMKRPTTEAPPYTIPGLVIRRAKSQWGREPPGLQTRTHYPALPRRQIKPWIVLHQNYVPKAYAWHCHHNVYSVSHVTYKGQSPSSQSHLEGAQLLLPAYPQKALVPQILFIIEPCFPLHTLQLSGNMNSRVG